MVMVLAIHEEQNFASGPAVKLLEPTFNEDYDK